MLSGLLTAAARASLPLAPGLKIGAPSISGAGAGKGLLARSITGIAFGVRPAAVTAGSDRQELEKRIGAELLRADPVLFLDNVNSGALRSEALASIMTDRPARVRVLGRSEMVEMNSTAFVIVTGNGLSLSEDLSRRFLDCELDARMEDPEARPLQAGFLDRILERRAELLSDVLTIWRWGRQNSAGLHRGQSLGSYEQWAAWIRDPLLALGCADPVARMRDAKANDPQRRRLDELFNAWWARHGDAPIAASALHEDVQNLVDPQGRGRQFVATYIAKLTGTRVAGFVVTAQRAGNGAQRPTRWAGSIRRANSMGHREHRGASEHRVLRGGRPMTL
jgi:hypothetical protein